MARTQSTKEPAKKTVTLDRRKGKDRRSGTDRRQRNEPVAVERRKGQRRKVQRRRQIDPTTCERDYTREEIEFMNALDEYKRRSGRMFPTCSEVLEVLLSLGYVKLTEEQHQLLASAGRPAVRPTLSAARPVEDEDQEDW